MKGTTLISKNGYSRWRIMAFGLGAVVVAACGCLSAIRLYRAHVAFDMERRGACLSFAYFSDPGRLSRNADGTPSRPWESDTPSSVRILGPHLASEVTAVSLKGDMFDDNDVLRLQHFRSLTKVTFEGLTLSRSTLTALAQLPSLHQVQLLNCVITGDSPASYRFPGKHVFLIDCQTNRTDFCALGQSDRLKCLHVASPQSSDEAMEALTTHRCAHLQSILLASPCSELQIDAFRRTHKGCQLLLWQAGETEGWRAAD